MEITDILLDFMTDDDSIPPGCAAAKWGQYMLEAAKKWGRPLDSPKFYKQQLEDAGFVNVVELIYKWPSNSWPRDRKHKELGTYNATAPMHIILVVPLATNRGRRPGFWAYEDLGEGASGLSMALFTRALGWTAEAVETFSADVRRDMANRSIHGWWPM